MKFTPIIMLTFWATAASVLARPEVDQDVFESLESTGTANILVSFKNSKLDSIRAKFLTEYKDSDRPIRFTSFYRLHKAYADQIQAHIVCRLESFTVSGNFTVEQLWVTNQLVVRGATGSVVAMLIESEDVLKVEGDYLIPLDDSPSSPQSLAQDQSCALSSDGSPQWGVQRIQADKVWSQGFRGQGIVVANIDTGVRHTHEALRENYRQDYGWYDPYDHSVKPNDAHGRGTHAMGTLVGRGGIGVAPESKWIACKGCTSNGCSRNALLLCAQWMVCPTLPNGSERNCSMAPFVTSNGWTVRGGSRFFEDILKAYAAVGIVAVFPVGNGGPSCGTAKSPRDSLGTIAVGATTADDYVATFSGVGPTDEGNETIKPDVVAPGADVCSSNHESDKGYRHRSGTSIAAPHVAGIVALLLSKSPNLNVFQVREYVREGGEPINSSGGMCGGLPDTNYPNFQAGYGIVNATATLSSLSL